MRTAIIYISNHGTTEKVSREIASLLNNKEVEIFNLKKLPEGFDLVQFEEVILGTGIYAGMPQKKMKAFCENNKDFLLSVRLGLFACGMEPDESKQQQELDNAYPEVLRKHAVSAAFLGGEFNFEAMNLIEKTVIKKIAKTDQSVSNIIHNRIVSFAAGMSD